MRTSFECRGSRIVEVSAVLEDFFETYLDSYIHKALRDSFIHSPQIQSLKWAPTSNFLKIKTPWKIQKFICCTRGFFSVLVAKAGSRSASRMFVMLIWNILDIYDTRSERLNWELWNSRADTTRLSRLWTNNHLQPSHRWGRFPFIVMGAQIGPRTGINVVKICTHIELNVCFYILYICTCVRTFSLWSHSNSCRQRTCRHPGFTASPLRSAAPNFTPPFFYLLFLVYSALSYTNARTSASSSWLP